MGNMITQLSLRTRILLLVLASCCAFGAPGGIISIKEFWDSHAIANASYRKALLVGFDKTAKEEVQTAVSMLQVLSDRQQRGEMTLDEAKKAGADLLRKLNYGNEGYFWADTPDGTNVVYLGKASEGKNRFDLQDAKGKYLIREIIKNGMQPDGGFTDYYFPRPGKETPLPKRGYSLYFKPFDWVIGTGNYLEDLEARAAQSENGSRQRIISEIYVLSGVSVAVLIAISLITLALVRQLLSQIGTEPHELEAIARRIAEGDLTVRLSTGKTGIYEAMRRMVEGLRRVVEQVDRSALAVASAASGLHANAQQIADGSREVAAQASSVATAGEEMSATANDIAQNCHRAAENSGQASASARSGVAIVQETLENMNQIADRVCNSAMAVDKLGASSEQIGAIVETIEDIADQTNLLALNAAIEAARAGDQGRGFAVVADEVRRLSERTANATKEIARMIESIQKDTREAVQAMEEGVKEVELGAGGAMKSGDALEEILGQINQVTDQINHIATAAEEQTAVTTEISGNMVRITEVVQQTAQGADKSATAAAQLSRNAEELQQLVHHFKL